jgi:hypothetical protein
MRTRLILFLAGLATLFVISGCGGNQRAAVSGKVTIAGKGHLPGGIIHFISTADPGKVGGGMIKPDGTYVVHDAPVGECKVVIDNSDLDSHAKHGASPPPTSGKKGTSVPLPPPSTGGPADKAILFAPPKGPEIQDETNKGKSDLEGMKYAKIEANYATAEKTPLRATVKSGSNSIDFEVK